MIRCTSLTMDGFIAFLEDYASISIFKQSDRVTSPLNKYMGMLILNMKPQRHRHIMNGKRSALGRNFWRS